MGLVAKYFGGAASWEYLGRLKWKEVWFLYKIYEYQVTYDEIVQELSYDDKGRRKKLPPPARIKKLTEARIRERSGEVDETEDGE